MLGLVLRPKFCSVLSRAPLFLSMPPPVQWSSTVPRAVMKLKRGGGAMKTKSAVKKRFRVNGAGTLLRGQSGKRHLNEHKTRRKVNALGRTVAVIQPSIRKKYLRMLGM